MNWAVVMVAAAGLIFSGILAHGAATYSDRRARNVKYAERSHKVVEQIVEVQRSHPEIVKTKRMDRFPFFYVIHVCVFGYTMCVIAGAKLTSNVVALGDQARYTMASCFLVGSVLVLTGVVLGLRVGPLTIKPSVADHATASVLGDDIVLPYRLEMAGMGAMVVSSGIYSWTSFGSTTGSLGGWLTGGIALACALTTTSFYRAVEVFQRWDNTLITEAQARLEAGDGCASD